MSPIHQNGGSEKPERFTNPPDLDLGVMGNLTEIGAEFSATQGCYP